ncbi:MAG: hypothetical protein ACK5MT_13395 [Actinomycetales bacterium]
MAIDQEHPVVGGIKRAHDLQESRFSRARRAHDCHELPSLDDKIQARDGTYSLRAVNELLTNSDRLDSRIA